MSQQTQRHSTPHQGWLLPVGLAVLPWLAGCLNGLGLPTGGPGETTIKFREESPEVVAENKAAETSDEKPLADSADAAATEPPTRAGADSDSLKNRPATLVASGGKSPVVKRARPGSPSALRDPVTLNSKPKRDRVARPPLVRHAAWDEPVDDDPQSDNPLDGSTEPQQAPAPLEEVQRRRMALDDAGLAERVKMSRNNDRISLTVRDAPIGAVLGLIAEQHGLNVVAGDTVDQRISVTLTDVKLEDALDMILSVNGYAWTQQQDIIVVSSVSAEGKGFPAIQGRLVRVYPLNYVSAADVDKIVKGLLSPVGQSFVVQTSATDQRRTAEQLVVEDLPQYIDRVDAYLAETDVRPRQVMVEAHVLQVTLKDETKHGVNFDQMLRVAGATANVGTQALATGASPATLFTVGGGDLTAVIECLKSTTDAKTLASPKLAVLNGQEAHIQIGGKLGYLLTTTVQTTSMQSVNFLDFGVILKVTPIITADNKILLQVNPEVSTARLNPANNLPESETTTLDTKVMLADGQAIVIGGLIKETNTDGQSKIPYLGDMWGIGRLFQRRQHLRQRDEIIITLLPTIVPDEHDPCSPEGEELDRAHNRLLLRPLTPADRRVWEPVLPDASQGPREKKWVKAGSPFPPRPMVEEEMFDDSGGMPAENLLLPGGVGSPELLPPGLEEPIGGLPAEPLDVAPPDADDSAANSPKAGTVNPRRFGHLMQKPGRPPRVSQASFSQNQPLPTTREKPHAR